MSSRGTVFIGKFVKNLPSGWEVEMGTQHKLSTTKPADHVGGPVGTRIGFIFWRRRNLLPLQEIEPQYLCRSSLILISVPTVLSGLNRQIPYRSKKYLERTFHFKMKNMLRSVHFFIGLTVLEIIQRISVCGVTSRNSCILNRANG